MRVGLIARGENRGLGHLTWDFDRGFGAERVLLVEMGELARGFAVHADRFPDATRVAYDPAGFLDEVTVREWLDGLDVVYTAETFYDWRIVKWAREANVATVCHLMPELWHHGHQPLPHPDAWWTPTSWRLDHLPPATKIVPIPIPVDCPAPQWHESGPLRFVHVAGHRAAKDRGGTVSFMRALHHLNHQCSVRIVTQDGRLPSVGRLPPHVEFRSTLGGEADRWDLYRGSDVIVSPRRYGGLSLPINEALGMGLGVLMSDCDPNPVEWPISPIKVEQRSPILTGAGWVPTVEADPWRIAAAMDELMCEPFDAYRDMARMRAQEWARLHSWEKLRPYYEWAFGEVLRGG